MYNYIMQKDRYWLREGIIFGVIGFIISIFIQYALIRLTCGLSGECHGLATFLNAYVSLGYLIVVFIVCTPFTLFGMLVGWIIGKIKKRKQVTM